MELARKIRAVLACAALAAPLAAQNLVANPDFDGEPATTSPWTVAPTAFLEGESGPDLCPASSELRGPSLLVSPRQIAAALSNCVAVEPGELLHLDGRLRASRALDRSLLVRFFTDADCAEVELGAAGANQPGGADEWVTVAGSVVVPDGAAGAYLVPLIVDQGDALDPPPFDYAFDRVYLGRTARVLVDGFEGGSPCRWSEAPGAQP